MNLIFTLGPIEFILILLMLLFFLLPLIALINILSGKFEQNDKLIWVLIILLLPILGSILYFTIGTRSKISR
jgi:hypothetical protein